MKKRRLSIAMLASAGFLVLTMTAGAQILVSGNDEKVLWDDAGKAIFTAPGKDTISFIDIGNRENPKILMNVALENSIFGPPTNVAVHPNGEIAMVANSVTQIGWRELEAGAGQQSLHPRPDGDLPSRLARSRLASSHPDSTLAKKV